MKNIFKFIKILNLFFILFLIYKINLIHYNGLIIINIKKDISKEIEEIKKSNYKIDEFNNPILIHDSNEIDEADPFVIHNMKNLNYHGEGFDLFGINQKTNNYIKHEIAKKVLLNSISGADGVSSLYQGYSFSTNEYGQMTLPNMQNNNNINIYITESILPIKSSGKIPTYFKLKKNVPAKLYECLMQKNDEKNEKIFSIKEKEINYDNKISYDAIIILCNPNNIYFDKDSITIKSSENIIIPNLILKNNGNKNYIEKVALSNLNYFNYHEPISTLNATFYTNKSPTQPNSNMPAVPINENIAEKHEALLFKKTNNKI